jgi:ribose transport system substrate-binding protein
MRTLSLTRRGLSFIALAVLACGLSVVVSACGSSSSGSSEATSAPSSEESSGGSSSKGVEGLKVAYFSLGTSNAYLVAEKNAAEKKAKELGIELTLLESNFDPQEQINQMQLAQQRESFDYWILTAASGQQECGAVKSAIAAGVPIYLQATRVCDSTGEDFGALGFVGVQSEEAFQGWLEKMFSENEPQEVAVLTGPKGDDVTEETEEALEKAQEKYPGFEVVALENTDYTAGNAYQVTQDVLQAHPNLALIASNYAGMTGGVVQAVKAAGKTGKIKVYDLLGEKASKKFVENGEVVLTLPGLPATEVEYALETVAKIAEGEKNEPYEYNPLDEVKIKGGPYVTKANVAEFEPEY